MAAVAKAGEVRPFPKRYVNLDAARARYGDRVDRVGRFLFETDPLADAAADALSRIPRPEREARLSALLTGGPSGWSRAPREVLDLIEATEYVPAWVDWDRVDRGGELLFRSRALGGIVLGAKSLVLGYHAPDGNKPLAWSGRLVEQAGRRLDETAHFVRAVHTPGGMRPRAKSHAVVVRVRLVHASVRRMILASGRWDSDEYGIPINQHDMAATQLLFSLVVLLGLRELGMRTQPDEVDAFMHLWRYVAHVIGVHEELISPNEADAQSLAELIDMTQRPPDADSRALVTALVEANVSASSSRGWRDMQERTHRALAYAFIRELIGNERAESLGIEPSPMKHIVRLFRGAVDRTERLAQLNPRGRHRAIAQGRRFWDEVVRAGLGPLGATFALPQSLARVGGAKHT